MNNEVYVVTNNWIWGCEKSDLIVELFKNKDEALKCYDRLIKEENEAFEEEFDKRDIETEKVKYNDDTFTYVINQKGDYTKYHSIVNLYKQEVI